MPLQFLFLRGVLVLATSAWILLFSTSATAAERVVLRYRIFQESVSVPELANFARTGELSPDIRTLINRSGKNPDQLRQTLTQEVKVNPVLLYQVLNAPVGTAILDRVSVVIHTPGGAASRESLRSALVSSALADGKITLIEALENYPTQDVEVDGDAIASFYEQLTKLAQRLPKI